MLPLNRVGSGNRESRERKAIMKKKNRTGIITLRVSSLFLQSYSNQDSGVS